MYLWSKTFIHTVGAYELRSLPFPFLFSFFLPSFVPVIAHHSRYADDIMRGKSLYFGFSYSADNSIEGLHDQLWAIFMFLVLFININELIMPMFVPQRNSSRRESGRPRRSSGLSTCLPTCSSRCSGAPQGGAHVLLLVLPRRVCP